MDYYSILQVAADASQEDIRQAYHKMARLFHPDNYNGSKDIVEEYMLKINEAYEILSDEKKKEEYDLQLKEKNSFSREENYASATQHSPEETIKKQDLSKKNTIENVCPFCGSEDVEIKDKYKWSGFVGECIGATLVLNIFMLFHNIWITRIYLVCFLAEIFMSSWKMITSITRSGKISNLVCNKCEKAYVWDYVQQAVVEDTISLEDFINKIIGCMLIAIVLLGIALFINEKIF